MSFEVDTNTVDRDIEHRIENTDTDEYSDELATLNEEQRNIVQMQEIARYTVAPGVVRLPVDEVSTAHNSDQWTVDVKHPFKGKQRFFFEKPVVWDGSYEIEDVLDWYDIDNQNPYHLQLKRVTVEYDKEEDDWDFVEPPDYDAPIPTQLKRKLSAFTGRASVPWKWTEMRASGIVVVAWGLYIVFSRVPPFEASFFNTMVLFMSTLLVSMAFALVVTDA